MKNDNLWMLLVSKIPNDLEKQQEILDMFREAFERKSAKNYLILLRASYMGVRDLLERKSYYLELANLVKGQVQKQPDLAGGAPGLYLGFLGEDLQKTDDADLCAAGRSLSASIRLVSQPGAAMVAGVPLPELGPPSIPAEKAAENPQEWIELLLRTPAIFADASVQPAQLRLSAAEEPRVRAQALMLIGAHLENKETLQWTLGCYFAASAVDPTFDLPWAFLSHYSGDPHRGLEYANRALCANPRSLPGLVNRGSIFCKLNRPSEARRDLAEVIRFDQTNARVTLMCAQACLDAGDGLRAARLFRWCQMQFPNLPEPWFGLGRLFWRAGIPEMAERCQEKFRNLRHGNIPGEMAMVGRIIIEGPCPGTPVLVNDLPVGKTPVQLDELLPGEHRIAWEGGPIRRVMLDQAESLKVVWTGVPQEVRTEQVSAPIMFWMVRTPDGSQSQVPSREVLAGLMCENLDELPAENSLGDILEGVGGPISPFPPDTRLTVEWVFRYLLEAILADGMFDKAEHEILRAVRDRLLIDQELFLRLMAEAKAMAGSGNPDAGALDSQALYRRLYEKALEDGVLDPTEKLLLETVAEALLLETDPIEAVEVAPP